MKSYRAGTLAGGEIKVTLAVGGQDNAHLMRLVGPLDQYLRMVERETGVKIQRREFVLTVQGAQAAVKFAQACLVQLDEIAAERELKLDDVQLSVVGSRHQLAAPASEGESLLRTRRADLRPRTARQHDYLQAIAGHDITLGVGPAGTGKTYLAVACAVDALERETVDRIVLTRPAVEAGERLGFLPGDLAQKVDPYLRPLYDALYDLMGFERVTRYFERQVIEIAPLAFMRGRTLNRSFVILDEAQNTTAEQMKMFLTRIGFGSRAVITGDMTQIDLPRGQKSGLVQALQVLDEVEGIAIQHFTSEDVVRHPLVARIVDAYDRFQRLQEGGTS